MISGLSKFNISQQLCLLTGLVLLGLASMLIPIWAESETSSNDELLQKVLRANRDINTLSLDMKQIIYNKMLDGDSEYDDGKAYQFSIRVSLPKKYYIKRSIDEEDFTEFINDGKAEYEISTAFGEAEDPIALPDGQQSIWSKALDYILLREDEIRKDFQMSAAQKNEQILVQLVPLNPDSKTEVVNIQLSNEYNLQRVEILSRSSKDIWTVEKIERNGAIDEELFIVEP